ncbi:Rho GTPase activation protein [Neoconidiobolus thromboides FSU 785]|nr:Rho GTPase activation protein [Neoconidiobolus thromboides FSU 785]
MNQSKVFGVLLEESILKGKIKPDLNLPAVVYRCVEYLEKHQAYLEEGIYRLSASKRYDVHTIAGLLKLYLREMPSFILTNELQPEFVKIIGKL